MIFASTNARSLPPKITAMIEMFRELGLSFFCITETWLKNDHRTNEELNLLKQNENIAIITRNRGTRGGGVCLAYDTLKSSFAVEKLRANRFEILCCAGRVAGIGRKFVIFTCYLPPKMSASSLNDARDFLENSMEEMTRKHGDPIIIVTGDFNKKDIGPALTDFPEVKLVSTPPTRGRAHLDLTFTNMDLEPNACSALPPLEANVGPTTLDHKVVTIRSSFEKQKTYEKTTFKFRPYTQKGEQMFGQLLLRADWTYLQGSEDPAADMTRKLNEFVEASFPIKTRTVRSGDQPWMCGSIRRMSRRKRREYAINRRSDRWKYLDIKTQELVNNAKESFFRKVKMEVLKSNNTRAYFRALKSLNTDVRPTQEWNINQMYPGKESKEVAEEVACFFNQISQEYTPLEENSNASSCLPLCPAMHEISARLKWCKKPKSKVYGDIPPMLVTKYHDLLAIPLTTVFEWSFNNARWPGVWKSETVTVIPKCARPSHPSQLRNLSCTPLFSKVLEHFILKQLKSEIRLDSSQFGGIAGSSTDHFLIETWDRILRALEDGRAAATVASIDFEKAS